MSLIILDRDGVINYDTADFIKSEDEWIPIPGSLEAISQLSQNGYRIIIVSNQSGISRKKITITDLNAIHQKMMAHLTQFGGSIEAIFFCPHGPREGCDCRKPKPGMLFDIAKRLHISLKDVYFVGDSQRDIDAAEAAGAKPVLVRTGNGAVLDDSGNVAVDVPVYTDLAEFVDKLLSNAA
ncbi:MAG: D-glycero-beta-D-manno-heptose 1,7-bisphosphate 7-phosphatase [Proteobacteria bacterium]|nr:D-glycero-beta-D-manno-heptose 1,7-bisphosphate 7-phosphatase [Pseudomonadota bacterium]